MSWQKNVFSFNAPEYIRVDLPSQYPFFKIDAGSRVLIFPNTTGDPIDLIGGDGETFESAGLEFVYIFFSQAGRASIICF